MPSIVWDLLYRDRGVERGLNKVADAHDKAERRAKAYRVAAGAAFVTLGVAAVKFGTSSVRAYGEAEAAEQKLAFAFKQFPRLADTNVAALSRLSSELAKKTRFDDDATKAAQAQLGQFKLTGTQITQLTPLLQDYAARTGKDLPAAANDLGKAVLGQGRALRAVGINFKDTGTQAGNFSQLMGGLRSQVGGFAEREGKTAAGRIAILNNQFGELQETAGEHLAPAVGVAVESLTDLVTLLGENSRVVGPLAVGVAGVTTSLWLGHKAVKAYTVVSETLGTAMASNGRAARGLAAVVSKAGPWGLAIGTGATLLGVFASQQKAAERQTKAFTDTLTFQKGALDASSRQMLIQELATTGVLEAAKKAGIAESAYVRALLQGGSARDRLLAQLDDIIVSSQEAADTGRGNTTALLDQRAAGQQASDALKRYGGSLDASKRAAELADSAFTGTADATTDVKKTAAQAERELQDLAASLFKANTAALALSGSQIGFEQAVDDATRAVKENGRTLDVNTQRGRDNRTALNNLATASQAYITKLVESGASTKRVTTATKDARAEFIRVAIKMGASREEAKKLATQYGLLPKDIKIKHSTPGSKGARDDVKDLDTKINHLNGKKVKIAFGTNAKDAARALGISVKNYENIGGARGSIARSQIGVDPAVTFSHGHGGASGGPTVSRNIEVGTEGLPSNASRFARDADPANTLTAKLAGEGLQSKGLASLQSAVRARDAATIRDFPGGRPDQVKAPRGWGPIYAAMRAKGARSFTTYPGHHPSSARARDVTPHSWAIANAARRLSSVWYVIYRMKIASKSPGRGNVWRDYHPTNRRGDWRHVRHIHVARYDQGGRFYPGQMAYNARGGVERVLTARENRNFERLVDAVDRRGGRTGPTHVHFHFGNYVGNRSEIKREIVNMVRAGDLRAVLG